jgi:hypothetical protein
MKTPIYNPNAIKLIQILTLLFGLQINFLFAANPTDSSLEKHFSGCVTCSKSVLEIQKEELFNEFILLSPTTPIEATFSDEAADSEINLIPTTPVEASFDNDPEFISKSNLEYLNPITPAEADFND